MSPFTCPDPLGSVKVSIHRTRGRYLSSTSRQTLELKSFRAVTSSAHRAASLQLRATASLDPTATVQVPANVATDERAGVARDAATQANVKRPRPSWPAFAGRLIGVHDSREAHSDTLAAGLKSGLRPCGTSAHRGAWFGNGRLGLDRAAVLYDPHARFRCAAPSLCDGSAPGSQPPSPFCERSV
jgi:hypothetical protein